ncbi:glycerophosphodiester phosphodiesterase family protein [Mucilaginibacter phyllosphaerae]|uniref:Glycerophosphodiester phosphodiesterase family protein n=1 Tax=Mucilaginibacter phyllosphaerae TaxID=1812349 RepID=A0A4Y8ALI7_9SPHI|nr:glycerophosphodiester phosphodiesterase family protein [Mucilaginibacter phyllosphaerae]MBB3967538.1 glycerophosphoryl diester phosphodiesterase [Mucilaginibacter phyllosphaerae]TEW69402.1 glycerophosphodiester phosphodiesterase family protein [Mucilaginibacter phyllosphaerae]GGH21291.1 glycerophosphoryl diester phosphodiesterase [Mucilaginibacter phyllosphaerae]
MQKQLTTTLIAGLLLTTAVAFGQQNSPFSRLIKQLHNPNDKNIMVAAHRGDWRDAPENSLLAYQYAIDMGVDVIEIDLNMTSDNVVVVMHDQTIDRTTNGKGRPADYTLEELKKIRLKNALGRVTNHTIPTLREVMLLAKGKVLVNLDKSYDYYNEAYKVLKETGTLNQAIFKTETTYREVRKRYPTLLDSIVFMPVVSLDKPEAKAVINEYQKQIKPVAFELIFKKDSSAVLSHNGFINKNGSKIWINSLWASLNGGHDDDTAVDEHNINDSWDWIIAHGATMIQTDRPREMLAYLRKLHRHQ